MTTLFVQDTFTGALNTTLAAHIGETGATWSLASGSAIGDSSLADYALDGTGAVKRAGPAWNTIIRASGVKANADYSVKLAFALTSLVSLDDTVNIKIYGRLDPAMPDFQTTSRYILALEPYTFSGTHARLSIGYVTAAGAQNLAAAQINLNLLSQGATHELRMEFIGNTVNAYIDDVLQLTYDGTATGIIDPGRVGFFFPAGYPSIVPSEFSAGDFSSPSAPVGFDFWEADEGVSQV